MAGSREIEKGAYRGHGDVYRWLREHYESVAEWVAKKNPSGEAIAERLSDAGIFGARGKRPTSRAVRKVWWRVCRDVLAENERLATQEAERLAKQRELIAGFGTTRRAGTAPAPIGPPLAAVGSGSTSEARVLTRPDGQPESSVERNKRVIKERLEKSKNPAWARIEKGEDDGMRD
ncbi:hypothetical protein RZS28_18635 (plasmid) [Methylocapsa polymorpha]|uniref:Uncharacterized protein n=1 Tax=Methylocapsa polymorpha TaxID=3080828 RepID=A0ABZ0HY70_9HYPH|nr:hypothetical protein [Methylocapsa sp. RX1]WOJ91746.1 hypothetical protein RZS28_18635 [Methylocapsa sp. RX1]